MAQQHRLPPHPPQLHTLSWTAAVHNTATALGPRAALLGDYHAPLKGRGPAAAAAPLPPSFPVSLLLPAPRYTAPSLDGSRRLPPNNSL